MTDEEDPALLNKPNRTIDPHPRPIWLALRFERLSPDSHDSHDSH